MIAVGTTVVRALAHPLGLPATIARLNVCYGPTGWGGLPVEYFARVRAGEPIYQPTDGSEAWCSPISTDDVARFVPGLWDVAATTTTVVNLAGDEATTAREFTTYLAEQAGLPVEFVVDERSRSSYASDNTRRLELIGPCSGHWREGMLRALDHMAPGVLPVNVEAALLIEVEALTEGIDRSIAGVVACVEETGGSAREANDAPAFARYWPVA